MESRDILLQKKNKELKQNLELYKKLQSEIETLRDEINKLNESEVLDIPGIKTGAFVKDNYGVVRVDFIEYELDDGNNVRNIFLHGYGAFKSSLQREQCSVSNDAIVLIKAGDVVAEHEILSEEEFVSIMEQYYKSIKEPVKDWSVYKHVYTH